MREGFEAWFLALDYDLTRDCLSRTGEGYFFITTQALWEQFKRIKELENEVRHGKGASRC